MWFWIAALGLPFIGGLHRYASSYGYRGVSRRRAFDESWKTAVMLVPFSLLFIVAYLAE